ncbi:MAG: hypothetical protein V4482_00610 [Pseudomonadota bacterium]
MNILIVGGGFMGSAFRGCWAEHAITTMDPIQTGCVKNIDDLPPPKGLCHFHHGSHLRQKASINSPAALAVWVDK